MKSGISSILSVLALAAAFSSCEKEMVQLTFGEDDKAIRIVPEIASAYSKTNPVADGKETEFNEGDMIALICDTRHVTFRLGSKDWAPTDNYYLRWTDSPKTYSAFYPASESSVSFGNFELPTSQRTADRLASSDYMTCTLENVQRNAEGKLRLSMQRQMAMVCLDLSGVETGKRVQGMRVWTSTGFTEGKPNAERMYVSPYTVAPNDGLTGQNGTKYIAIVVPTAADASSDFISFNYDGKDYVLTGVPALQSGHRYEMKLNLAGTVSIGTPTVNPWDEGVGVIPGGDASKVSTASYFVKPQSSGNADGLSWENAMGMTEFLNFIKQKNATQAESDENAALANGRNFYFMAGTYPVSPIKVEYSGFASRVTFNVYGGYSVSSTGTDISKRDIEANETIFDGNGTVRFVTLGNQVEPTFDGITFKSLKSVGDGCITIAAGGSGDSRVNFTNCKFKSCTGSGAADNAQMPVILIWKGMARFNNVLFDECRAEKGVRGLIRLGGGDSRAYMNACRFVKCTWGGGGYGLIAHLNQSAGNLCMHNVTFTGNDEGCSAQGVVNGWGGVLIASSTLVSSNNSPVVRLDAQEGTGSLAVNSILMGEKYDSSPVLELSGTGRLKSCGGNLFVGKRTFTSFTSAENDEVYDTFSAAATARGFVKGSVGTEKYLWNGTTDFTKLTKEEVRAAIKSYSNTYTGKLYAGSTEVYDGAKAGEDFLNWLDSINAFDADCYGNARNASAFWPGSYQGQ
ncbi:MAG: fimbrillin family protein [Rikenellaceae bacterium]|nr:fimbrillin family protein [Rikenellaceae bacterium]